jgi:hypothetical protein
MMRIISNTLKRSYEQNLKGILSKKRTEPLLPSVLVTLGGGTPPPLSEVNVILSIYCPASTTIGKLSCYFCITTHSIRVVAFGAMHGG